MSDEPPLSRVETTFPIAHIRPHHFSAIWLIPILAALIAIYLGWHSYSEHGPHITISFKTAQDIIPGQTQLRYKAVTLGTVEAVHLNPDLSGVIVDVQMTSQAKSFLTDRARFWVVRPQLSVFNASDIETLVTGSYIQVEPGVQGGHPKGHFVGLETPPTDRTDEQGSEFVLSTTTLGSLNIGSPVNFRGIEVGEVLGYDMLSDKEPLSIKIFIRKPYDRYVREHSEFWNASGLSLSFGPSGVHLTTHSLRSVLVGGVSFDTPLLAQNENPAANGATFPLYESEAQAKVSQYRIHIPYIAYFQSSVKELGVGSPVMIYGIQVGDVTEVKLVFDDKTNQAKVRVAFEIQPDRALGVFQSGTSTDPSQMMRRLIDSGLRVKLESNNLLLGEKMLTLEFAPNEPSIDVVQEDGVMILPTQSGSTDNLLEALSDVVNKLNTIPFEHIGNNLNTLLLHMDQTINGHDMRQALHSLSIAMANAADLSHKADLNLTPALQKLPDISAQIQSAVTHANGLMTGLDNGYGQGSDFEKNTKRVLDEVNDAARSIRLLADYIERHPEALLKGKTYSTKEKP